MEKGAQRGPITIGGLHLPPAIPQARTNHADLGMRLRKIQELAQGIWGDPGVIVEEEQVASARPLRGLVVGSSETLIDSVPNQDYFRGKIGHHVRRAVHGAV